MGQYETGENDYDQPLHHLFEQNGQTGFLAGMQSHHDNHAEDRQFKYVMVIYL
jgi:hypothetical protein